MIKVLAESRRTQAAERKSDNPTCTHKVHGANGDIRHVTSTVSGSPFKELRVAQQPIKIGDKTASSRNVVLIKMFSRVKSRPTVSVSGPNQPPLAHEYTLTGTAGSGPLQARVRHWNSADEQLFRLPGWSETLVNGFPYPSIRLLELFLADCATNAVRGSFKIPLSN